MISTQASKVEAVDNVCQKLAVELHLPAQEVQAVIAGKMIPEPHVFEAAVGLILK